ncbi:MAG: GNAT family N-acetyltransferase [Candidatus Dormiibacterota bacterium]
MLEPLTEGHAVEMAGTLADRRHYTFTGGAPPTLAELASRYAAQGLERSPDGTQRWLNWVLRERSSGAAMGYLQATLTADRGGCTADLAWVIGPAHQGRGFATEGAERVVRWLGARGVARLRARIHPDNRASVGVALKLGLTATAFAGEVTWEGWSAPNPGR